MRRLGLALTILLLLGVVLVPSAGAVPPLPSSFWGSLTMNGAQVQLSSELTAWVEGVQCGKAQVFVYEDTTAYSISVTGDDPETPGREGGNNGDTVHFKLNGTPLATTATWIGGNGYERLDMNEMSPHRATTSPRMYVPLVLN